MCEREPSGEVVDAAWSHLDGLLTPDNLTPRPARIVREHGTTLMLTNPSRASAIHGASVCLGALLAPDDDWWRPGSPLPDGSYALFRVSGTTIELASDTLASRTLWYFIDERRLLASTSQRAIVALLGSFELNPGAVAWMLSSGSLGPDNAWDARIRCLLPGAVLRLDRAAWTVALERDEPRFAVAPVSDERHQRRLADSLDAVMAELELAHARHVLPLSGGVDSRALLSLLHRRHRLDCVTWGMASSLADPTTDSAVAARVARHFAVPHRFYATDVAAEPFERLLDRFLVAGEGRVDRISGYMDGFAVWRRLFDDGCDAILRGDEAFGWQPAATTVATRLGVGLQLLGDHANLGPFARELPRQSLPRRLARGRDESLATWRDRLYQDFRVPVLLAGLNDLKSAYVEVVNPLLARAIVMQVRTLPDHLRTDKALFRALVTARGPAIPFAQRAAIELKTNILRHPDATALMCDELASGALAGLLPPALVRRVRDRLAPGRPAAARTLLTRVQGRLFGKALDESVIGLRLFIASRMSRLLARDARALAAAARA